MLPAPILLADAIATNLFAARSDRSRELSQRLPHARRDRVHSQRRPVAIREEFLHSLRLGRGSCDAGNGKRLREAGNSTASLAVFPVACRQGLQGFVGPCARCLAFSAVCYAVRFTPLVGGAALDKRG